VLPNNQKKTKMDIKIKKHELAIIALIPLAVFIGVIVFSGKTEQLMGSMKETFSIASAFLIMTGIICLPFALIVLIRKFYKPSNLQFKNPWNGYTEEVKECELWVFLFAPIYFLYRGIWTHAALSLIIGFFTYGVSVFVYPFFAKRIIIQHYLRNGWTRIEDP
jgi:hypothetical protein